MNETTNSHRKSQLSLVPYGVTLSLQLSSLSLALFVFLLFVSFYYLCLSITLSITMYLNVCLSCLVMILNTSLFMCLVFFLTQAGWPSTTVREGKTK